MPFWEDDRSATPQQGGAKMKATITIIKKELSNYGGDAFLIGFSGEDGKSYRTWVYENCGNYQRWRQIIAKGVGTAVGNLNIKSGRLINADSFPVLS